MSSGGESPNMLNCLNWCEKENTDYGVLTGFSDNTIRTVLKNALWNYHIDSDSYGVVECVPGTISRSCMKYCFVDGTLCETPSDPDGHNVRYWDHHLILYD